MRKTKVICTVGPASSSKEGLKSLVDAGMDVARLNFSHGTYEEHKRIIDDIKDLRKGIKRSLAILLDTKGPEVRTRNASDLLLKEGDRYSLHGGEKEDGIPIFPESVLNDLSSGDTILLDDGHIKGTIHGDKEYGFSVEILSAGMLKPNKSVNFPGVKLDMPYLNEKDKEDILFGVKMGVEAIAASFAMSAEHILSIKELLRKENAEHILVFSKIESLEGIHHFDEILEVSDGIMVARGDLAVECSFSHVPPMQKMMINKCNIKGKPVIVATQMLESMVTSKSPTRAEVSDVANSVFDGTSCTMLSGETAVGEHPAHTVSVMCEILREAEKESGACHILHETINNVSSKIAFSAVQSANEIEAGAILVFSRSGRTARKISALRPKSQVIVVTPEESTYHQSAFLFGGRAMMEVEDYAQKDFNPFMRRMLQEDWVSYGDFVVITMGVPFGVSYTTNTIRIESVGNAIIRGEADTGSDDTSILAEVVFFFPRGDKREVDYTGKIVILKEFFKDSGELLTGAAGIILQNAPYDTASEDALNEFSTKHDVPYIKRAEGAMSLIKEGQKLRLEPAIGLVFKEDTPTKSDMLNRK